MAEASWPSPNHNTGAVNDEEYEKLAHPQAGDGIVGTPADTSVVFADSSGRQVKVRANKFGVVRGRHWDSGSVETTVAVAANSSGSTRIDTAVLRLTRATWDVTFEIVQGTPGAGAPALTQDLGVTGVYEIPLGDATVIDGSTNITAAQFTRREYYLGEQLIVCLSTNRPPHASGRRIWETDTGKEYVSTGVAWVQTYPVVAADDDSGVVNITPASGWSAAGANYVRVRRRNGTVHLQFHLRRTGAGISANGQVAMLTVPSGHRPPAAFFGGGVWSTFDGLVLVNVSTSGVVQTWGHDGIPTNHEVIGTLSWAVA